MIFKNLSKIHLITWWKLLFNKLYFRSYFRKKTKPNIIPQKRKICSLFQRAVTIERQSFHSYSKTGVKWLKILNLKILFYKYDLIEILLIILNDTYLNLAFILPPFCWIPSPTKYYIALNIIWKLNIISYGLQLLWGFPESN